MQTLAVVFSQGAVIRSHEIGVERGVGVLGRADGHIGKLEGCKRVGRDRGGNWRLLPGRVRVVDQHQGSGESKHNNSSPEELAMSSLSINVSRYYFLTNLKTKLLQLDITFEVEM